MDGDTTRIGQLESPAPGSVSSSRKKVWFVVIAVAAIFLIFAGVVAWFGYLNPEAREERALQEKADRAQAALNTLEEALRNDTYGGKSPEETLQLFIAALEAGDVELASKYFALEDNMNDPDYLTRRKWEEGLRNTQREGKLSDVISLLKSSKPAGSAMEGYFGFSMKDENGQLIGEVGMKLNKSSWIWKIESL